MKQRIIMPWDLLDEAEPTKEQKKAWELISSRLKTNVKWKIIMPRKSGRTYFEELWKKWNNL